MILNTIQFGLVVFWLLILIADGIVNVRTKIIMDKYYNKVEEQNRLLKHIIFKKEKREEAKEEDKRQEAQHITY